MAVRKCKFCGCSERHPCSILVRITDIDNFEILSSAIVQEFDGAIRAVPCAWLLPDVCTNPSCVEKAYYEARVAVESLIDQSLISARNSEI